MKFDKNFAGGFESYTITLQLGIYNSLHRLETLLQGACIVMFNKNRLLTDYYYCKGLTAPAGIKTVEELKRSIQTQKQTDKQTKLFLLLHVKQKRIWIGKFGVY